jgi:quercetin dioxygenase-like cupin family protein
MTDTSTSSSVTMADVAAWPVEDLGGLEGRYFTVEVPPGLRAPLHHHDGWQFIYVLDGAVVSQMEGEPAVRYQQGEAWYEAHGRKHVMFANESDRPAKVLVFFLTEPGTPALAFD